MAEQPYRAYTLHVDHEVDHTFKKIVEDLEVGEYSTYEWDENTEMVLKEDTLDLFQISKEKGNIVIYPIDSCSVDFIEELIEDIREIFPQIGELEKYTSHKVRKAKEDR